MDKKIATENKDPENKAWVLPINGLDGMIAAEVKLLCARYTDTFQMQYFKNRQEPMKTNSSVSGVDWGKTT